MATATVPASSPARPARVTEITTAGTATLAILVALGGVWWAAAPLALVAAALSAAVWRKPASAWRNAALALTGGAVALTAVVGLVLTPAGSASNTGPTPGHSATAHPGAVKGA